MRGPGWGDEAVREMDDGKGQLFVSAEELFRDLEI